MIENVKFNFFLRNLDNWRIMVLNSVSDLVGNTWIICGFKFLGRFVDLDNPKVVDIQPVIILRWRAKIKFKTFGS